MFLFGWLTAMAMNVAYLEKEYFEQSNAMYTMLNQEQRDQLVEEHPILVARSTYLGDR